MKARPIHVRPEPQLRAALESEAKKRGVTISDLVRDLLANALHVEAES